jgi:predicted RNA-binding Zn ribbon-like protein
MVADNGRPVDLLKTFADFVEWSVEAGVITRRQAERAIGQPTKRDAVKMLDLPISFRDSLKSMTYDLAKGKAAPQASLDRINEVLSRKNGFFEVRRTREGYEKQFHAEFHDLADLLIPIAESAADLLCFGDLEQVKKCENESCVLHFYDISKNHRRRWCSMAACGNRAKAAAFYERKKHLDKKD